MGTLVELLPQDLLSRVLGSKSIGGRELSRAAMVRLPHNRRCTRELVVRCPQRRARAVVHIYSASSAYCSRTVSISARPKYSTPVVRKPVGHCVMCRSAWRGELLPSSVRSSSGEHCASATVCGNPALAVAAGCRGASSTSHSRALSAANLPQPSSTSVAPPPQQAWCAGRVRGCRCVHAVHGAAHTVRAGATDTGGRGEGSSPLTLRVLWSRCFHDFPRTLARWRRYVFYWVARPTAGRLKLPFGSHTGMGSETRPSTAISALRCASVRGSRGCWNHGLAEAAAAAAAAVEMRQCETGLQSASASAASRSRLGPLLDWWI
eukprot:COSAG01_NODE_3165_length_6476_cov_31.556845_1_plen_321_part_00